MVEMQLDGSIETRQVGLPARVRFGFGVCGAALCLVLVYILGRFATALLAAALRIDLEGAYATALEALEFAVEAATDLLFFAGLVALYGASAESRWQWTARLLLLMLGVDLASLSLRILDADSGLVNVTSTLCSGLGWIELWMLAVLAAEAAERIERPDITYETEVIGRLIIWGGFAWLGLTAWTFKLTPIATRLSVEQPDNLAVVLGSGTAILQLIVLARSAMCCARLSPMRKSSRPG